MFFEENPLMKKGLPSQQAALEFVAIIATVSLNV
jgi:hypothetical protein